jgi:hypothetical protein
MEFFSPHRQTASYVFSGNLRVQSIFSPCLLCPGMGIPVRVTHFPILLFLCSLPPAGCLHTVRYLLKKLTSDGKIDIGSLVSRHDVVVLRARRHASLSSAPPLTQNRKGRGAIRQIHLKQLLCSAQIGKVMHYTFLSLQKSQGNKLFPKLP